MLELIQSSILSIQLGVVNLSKAASEIDWFGSYGLDVSALSNVPVSSNCNVIPNLARDMNWYYTKIISYIPHWNYMSLAVDYFMVSSLFISFFFVLFGSLIGGLMVLNRLLNILGFLQRLFSIIENEFTAPRSLFIIIMVLTSTLFLTSCAPAFSLKIPLFVYLLLSMIGLLLSMVLLWPISLIYNWGAYCTIYIKGEATMANLLGQVIMDYFYLISFFLRINLQFIRLVVLSGVFIVYNEFYFEFIYPLNNFDVIPYNAINWTDYAIISFRVLLTCVLRFIYELGHMWVVLIMQANAFIMILFLILQSLHTVYLYTKLLSFFKNKRK